MRGCLSKEVCRTRFELQRNGTNEKIGKLDDISVVAAQCKRRKT